MFGINFLLLLRWFSYSMNTTVLSFFLFFFSASPSASRLLRSLSDDIDERREVWAWKKTKTHALARWIFTALSAVCLYKCKANDRERKKEREKNNQRTRVTSIQMLWFNSSTNRTGCRIEIDKKNEQWSGLLNGILLRVACALECWSACSSLLNLSVPILALMRQHLWRTRKKCPHSRW